MGHTFLRLAAHHTGDRVADHAGIARGNEFAAETSHSYIKVKIMMVLSAVAARVLGSLIEKEITTPEYYPLSMNALVNACNQKNNRDPEMHLDEEEVREALRRLEDHGLAGPVRGIDSRVTKYEHRVQEVFNFTRGETAVMCVLLLRGPQTPGELRGRTERMHRFEELSDVQATLSKLIERETPLVKVMARLPGTKEARYAHLLSGEPADTVTVPAEQAVAGNDLHAEVAALREEVAELRAQVEKVLRLVE